ncbi:MAG: glycosyltransferase family 2 protein [Cytophagaceae bacterium]|nr:glycosyltransferase family 2 protein [Cytophagaceae bacterium]
MSASSTPLVSIALCTYNGAPFLEAQLDSIFSQTYTNIEVIAVDDVSSDRTVEILKNYSTRYNLKVFINEKNLGYIKNFERAISLCNGDYIALCDQDDIWEKSKIEVLLKGIGENQLIYSDSEMIRRDGTSLNKKISDVQNFVQGHQPESFLFHNCVAGHTCLFKKELKNYIFPFPEKLYHDWWIVFAASSVGKITYVNSCLTRYRQHESANTDMLHLRTPEKVIEGDKSRKLEQRTINVINNLSIYYGFKYLSEKDRNFIGTLIENYKRRLNHYFSLRLLLFWLKHYEKLLYISKDPWIYKYVFAIKESFGTKLKKLYYKYKEA